MTPDLLFKNFDLLIESPKNLNQIRTLILEMAFNGKLINEDTSTWEESTIIEISDEITPGFACGRQHVDSKGHVHLRTHNISTNGKMNLNKVVRISSDKVDAKKSSIRKGDILFNNTNSQELVGKSSLVEEDLDFAFSNHLTRIRVNEDIYPAFLVYRFVLLLRKGFFSEICTRWINQAAVNTKALKDLPLLYPSITKQKRIVAKVDQLMGLCDELEEREERRKEMRVRANGACLHHLTTAKDESAFSKHWRRVCDHFDLLYDIPENVQELRQTILQLAVMGKLVKQDPKDEPAKVLLEKIAQQRERLVNSGSLRKTKPCRQFSSNEVPHEIPNSWTWTMLGEISEVGTGSTPSRTEPTFWNGGSTPWITSGSTSQSPITEGDEFVTMAAVKAHRLRIYPPGALLVALYGQGKTRGQVAELAIPATINQACAAICTLDGTPTIQDYLFLLLEKQYEEMRSFSAGGAQPNLNVQKIKEVFVPLPPLAEQRRIVAKVNQLMGSCDDLETKLNQSRSESEKLMEAVVGELVNGN